MKQKLLISSAALMITAAVHADIWGFDVITTNSPQGQYLEDYDQFLMTAPVASGDNCVRFDNTGSYTGAVITKIYFGVLAEKVDTINLQIDSVDLSASSTAVDFIINNDPGPGDNPPGWADYGDWWAVTVAGAEADKPPPKNGIDVNEFLTLCLSYTDDDTVAFSDLLTYKDVIVALHVQSIDGAGSETFRSRDDAIPEPGSVALLGLSAAGLAFIRRRFSA